MLVRKGESDISIIVFSSPLVRGKVLDACEEGGIRYFYNSIFKSTCAGEKFETAVCGDLIKAAKHPLSIIHHSLSQLGFSRCSPPFPVKS